MPERIARGAVHLANLPIGEIDRGGDPVPLNRRQIVKRRQGARFGARIIIHHHQPIGIKLLNGQLHAIFKPACPADIAGAGLHHQTRILQRGQPLPGAIGADIVHHHHRLQKRRRLVQQARDRGLQLVQTVMCHHDSHQAACLAPRGGPFCLLCAVHLPIPTFGAVIRGLQPLFQRRFPAHCPAVIAVERFSVL